MTLSGRRIVLVEDDEIMGTSILHRLKLEGADVQWQKLAARAIGAIRTPRRPLDAVVCDVRLPDGTGEDVYAAVCRTIDPPPFLFVTGQGEIEQAVRLLRAGAADYFTKPFDMSRFLGRLAQIMPAGPSAGSSALLGPSPAARRVEERARAAARSDLPVLIRGAAGVGKGLVARRIHRLSERSAAPFVAVDFARTPVEPPVLPRAFEDVGEGVLLLLGLDRADATSQDALMRWLDRSPDTRLIAAASPAAGEAVAAGALRADLLYRLNRIEIPIPPLSERREDAVWHLHALFARLNPLREKPLRGISALADAVALAHDWPGNGREVRARLRQALDLARTDWLHPADLFPERHADADNGLASLADARDAAERAHILAALERSGGHVVEAARLLRVSRTTLWEKMQKLGL